MSVRSQINPEGFDELTKRAAEAKKEVAEPSSSEHDNIGSWKTQVSSKQFYWQTKWQVDYLVEDPLSQYINPLYQLPKISATEPAFRTLGSM